MIQLSDFYIVVKGSVISEPGGVCGEMRDGGRLEVFDIIQHLLSSLPNLHSGTGTGAGSSQRYAGVSTRYSSIQTVSPANERMACFKTPLDQYKFKLVASNLSPLSYFPSSPGRCKVVLPIKIFKLAARCRRCNIF